MIKGLEKGFYWLFEEKDKDGIDWKGNWKGNEQYGRGNDDVEEVGFGCVGKMGSWRDEKDEKEDGE